MPERKMSPPSRRYLASRVKPRVIARLAVDPQARRQGIAKALVRAAESVLWRRGARRMSVLVERHEAHAVAFWDSLAEAGYQRDPRMMRYVKALGGDGS